MIMPPCLGYLFWQSAGAASKLHISSMIFPTGTFDRRRGHVSSYRSMDVREEMETGIDGGCYK